MCINTINMLSFNALLTLTFPYFLFIFLLVQLFEVTLFQLFSISFTSEVISGQNCACRWCVYVCEGVLLV